MDPEITICDCLHFCIKTTSFQRPFVHCINRIMTEYNYAVSSLKEIYFFYIGSCCYWFWHHQNDSTLFCLVYFSQKNFSFSMSFTSLHFNVEICCQYIYGKITLACVLLKGQLNRTHTNKKHLK